MTRRTENESPFELRDLLLILALFLAFPVARASLGWTAGSSFRDDPAGFRDDPAGFRDDPAGFRGDRSARSAPRATLAAAEPVDTMEVDWEGWHELERTASGEVRRWADGLSPELTFPSLAADPRAGYRFDFELEATTAVTLRPVLNGVSGAELRIPRGGVFRRSVVFPSHALVPGPNRLSLALEGEPVVESGGSRELLLALRSVGRQPLDSPVGRHFSFLDDSFFGPGWSEPEVSFRWTMAERARLVFPLERVDGRSWSLLVTGASGWPQGVELVLNEEFSCHWSVDGWEHRVLVFELPVGALRDGLNELEIVIENPTRVEGDPRSLGWAFEDLYIYRPSQLPEDVGRAVPVENGGGLWRACSPS